jgi:hypothetical protein
MGQPSRKATSLISVLIAFLGLNVLLNIVYLLDNVNKGNVIYALVALIQILYGIVLAYYCYKRNTLALGFVSVASFSGLRGFLQEIGKTGTEGLIINLLLTIQFVLMFLPLIILARIDKRMSDLEKKPSFTKSCLKFLCIWGIAGLYINVIVYLLLGLINHVFLEDNNLMMLTLIAPPILTLLAFFVIKKESYFGMAPVCIGISITSLAIVILCGEIQNKIDPKPGILTIYTIFSYLFFIVPEFFIALIAYMNSAIDVNRNQEKGNSKTEQTRNSSSPAAPRPPVGRRI